MKNLRLFMIKTAILFIIILLSRALFQFPIEYFQLDAFRQTAATRIFSKIDALKILSLVAVFFTLYYRKAINRIKQPKVNWKEVMKFAILGEVIIALYYMLRACANVSGISPYIIWPGIILLLAMAFTSFTAAVFGKPYLKKMFKKFKKELIYAGITSIVLYNLLMLFQKQWYFFSKNVSEMLYRLLDLKYAVDYFPGNSGPILQINDFAVAIGPPCSGIDSMLLFTAFMAGIYALDHKRVKKYHYLPAFLLGFIGIFAVNILRLLLLIIIGTEVSPDLAVGLFHTQAGWVLFLVYFFCYYYLMKKFIYKKSTTR